MSNIETDREGMIQPGSVPWFPAEKFDGYLWGKEHSVYISVIESKQPGTGNLSHLFDVILQQGRNVKVPTPFARMQSILEKKGFAQTTEETDFGPCEVWVKAP